VDWAVLTAAQATLALAALRVLLVEVLLAPVRILRLAEAVVAADLGLLEAEAARPSTPVIRVVATGLLATPSIRTATHSPTVSPVRHTGL
jgi:hypothetical protein